MSVAVTATNQTIFLRPCKPLLTTASTRCGGAGLGVGLGLEGRDVVHQANLALTFPHHLEEALGQLDRFRLGLGLDDRLLAFASDDQDHGTQRAADAGYLPQVEALVKEHACQQHRAGWVER